MIVQIIWHLLNIDGLAKRLDEAFREIKAEGELTDGAMAALQDHMTELEARIADLESREVVYVNPEVQA